jgi:8-oxo-dGTP diphosphatase
MGHIHTESGHHDHTVSAFIVRIDGDEPKILLHIHKILKKYLQFGGHIELDENPWQAVEHEILEESGYKMGQLKLLQPKSRITSMPDTATLHPYPVYHLTHGGFDIDHNHTDVGYVFTTEEDPKHGIGENESEDIKAFSRTEIEKMDDEIVSNVKEICLFIFDEVLKNWQTVPIENFTK